MHSLVLKKHGGVLGLCRMLYQFARYIEQQATFTALAVFEFSEQRSNIVPLCGLSLHSLFFFLSYKLPTHAHTCVLICPGGVVSGRALTSAPPWANIHTSVWHVPRNVVTPVRARCEMACKVLCKITVLLPEYNILLFFLDIFI